MGRFVGRLMGVAKDVAPAMLGTAVPIGMRILMQLLAVYCQSATGSTWLGLTCPDANQVKEAIALLQWILGGALIAILILVIIFNVLGSVSFIFARVGEIINERIRFVWELLLIYVLFLLGLSPDVVEQGYSNCAYINWGKLLNNGPLFFRLIGAVLSLVGLPVTSST